LQAGKILSWSLPAKICRISIENEKCDIIENLITYFLKNHITDIIEISIQTSQILNMEACVITTISFPAMQFLI
jgi:hypothetical protein